jgi:hypothetical protein
MGSDGLFTLISLGGLGVLFLVLGTLARLGFWRGIYAVKGYPVYMPRELIFIFIPGGLMSLSLLLIVVLPIAKETRGNLVMYVFAPMLVITYILAIWQPWWLKPAWLRWLEKKHGDILEILWEDVRKDRWRWEREVRTQEDLEAWVAEVRQKHGLKE